MCEWKCREGKGRCVTGSVENGKADDRMGLWRRERAMSGWDFGEGKG